jgi:Protein of unknown function (DUF2384)
MSLKAFYRAALRERLSAKRQGAKKAASPKSREFNELLDRLAMHLNWKSVNPLKDARAVGRILLRVKIANRSSSVPKATLKRAARLPHRRERIMVTDDQHLASSSAVKTDRQIPSANLADLLSTVLEQPDKWMATPNYQFGGRRPSELIGTAEETKIFDLLNAVDQGLF